MPEGPTRPRRRRPGQGFVYDDDRVVLLLDVDGVLNSDGESPWPETRTYFPRVRTEWGMSACRVVTSANIGRALLDLDVEIRWLTTWGQEANRKISPRAGLPGHLPVAGIPEDRDRGSMEWKEHIVVRTLLSGRPVVWIDDEADGRLESAVRLRAPDCSLLVVQTDPATGITPGDIEAVREHLETVAR